MTQRRFPDDSLTCSVLGLVWVWSGSGTGVGSGLGLGPDLGLDLGLCLVCALSSLVCAWVS